MNFLSDTTAPAHPHIIEAIAAANDGYAPSYGADAISDRLKARLRALFETDLELVLAISGTASNALALSTLCPADAAIVCHDEAHIHRDERGAPEFFTGGAKLLTLAGAHAKIDPAALDGALEAWPQDFVHASPPRVLSLSQLNESGCAYTREEIAERADRARAAGLFVHMDGARFANALAHLDCAPAAVTWRAGVDALCLGATKNGALAAEAVILFPSVTDRLPALQARQKRSGHMAPKMRYVAAQLDAWLTDALWLDLAGRANAAGRRIAEALTRVEGVEIAHPVDGNEVFARLPDRLNARLSQAGARFYTWPDGSSRFVASWCTSDEEIAALEQTVEAP